MTGEKLLTAKALAMVGNYIVYEVTFKPTVSRGTNIYGNRTGWNHRSDHSYCLRLGNCADFSKQSHNRLKSFLDSTDNDFTGYWPDSVAFRRTASRAEMTGLVLTSELPLKPCLRDIASISLGSKKLFLSVVLHTSPALNNVLNFYGGIYYG